MSKMLTFVRNRGDLAEGWYDAATLQKAQGSAASASASSIAEPERRLRGSPQYGSPAGAEESSEEDIVGPTLPGQDNSIHRSNKRAGPAIPTLQDLELRRGQYVMTIPGKQIDTSATQNSTTKTPSLTVKPSNMTASMTAKSKKATLMTWFPGPNPAAKTVSSKRNAKKRTPTAPLPPPKQKLEAWKRFMRTICWAVRMVLRA